MIEIVMITSVAEFGRGYQPGQVCMLPDAKALEWERFGWCRFLKPKTEKSKRSNTNELVA